MNNHGEFRGVTSTGLGHPEGCSIHYEFLYKVGRRRDCWDTVSQSVVKDSIEEFLQNNSVLAFGYDFTLMASSRYTDGVGLRVRVTGLFLNPDQMSELQYRLCLYVSFQF